MQSTERKLAAIMFTDIVGYTALTQSDEAQALQALEVHNQLLGACFPKFHGRKVKTMGDSFLVEFDNALDAVRCAIEIQKTVHDYDFASIDNWKFKLRVGIHLGDVIHKDGDIFGDAVNIASRIEPLAEPEGVCISEQVFDQVHNKVKFALREVYHGGLKNVAIPIRVFKVIMPWETTQGRSKETASDKKRIAVLPFSNISPDPNDGYFADGLTEELITILSLVKELQVIARTSVIQYKTNPKPVAQIGSESDVHLCP